MYKPNKFFLVSLFSYCVVAKVLPFALGFLNMDITSTDIYPWSFTPIFAFGIFGVAMFRNLRLAFGLPVLALVVGDVLIGLLMAMKLGWAEGFASSFYASQPFQYLSLLLASCCGLLVRANRNWGSILASALAGPTLFFLVSNFAVWQFDTMIGYPRDLTGLQLAYIAGLPFYKYQLVSTVAFSALLFSPVGIGQLRKVEPAARKVAQPALAKQ